MTTIMPRTEWDGGFLWKPYVPRRNDGIYQSINQSINLYLLHIFNSHWAFQRNCYTLFTIQLPQPQYLYTPARLF